MCNILSVAGSLIIILMYFALDLKKYFALKIALFVSISDFFFSLSMLLIFSTDVIINNK